MKKGNLYKYDTNTLYTKRQIEKMNNTYDVTYPKVLERGVCKNLCIVKK